MLCPTHWKDQRPPWPHLLRLKTYSANTSASRSLLKSYAGLSAHSGDGNREALSHRPFGLAATAYFAEAR